MLTFLGMFPRFFFFFSRSVVVSCGSSGESEEAQEGPVDPEGPEEDGHGHGHGQVPGPEQGPAGLRALKAAPGRAPGLAQAASGSCLPRKTISP